MDITAFIPSTIGGVIGGLVAVFFCALPIALFRDWSKALRFRRKHPMPAWQPPQQKAEEKEPIDLMAPTEKMMATREKMIGAYEKRRAKTAVLAPLLTTGQHPAIRNTDRISLARVRLELDKNE